MESLKNRNIIHNFEDYRGFDERLLKRTMNVHPFMINRYAKELELIGHTGCVNRIAWNETGTRIVTGSDDLHIGIWDYPSGQKRKLFATPHVANIFGVRFLDEQSIVSGAMDFLVQLHLNPFESSCSTVYCCHKGRVKDVEVEPGGSGNLWWSASEDGTVRQFDRRLPHAGCSASYNGNDILEHGHRDHRTSKNVLIMAMYSSANHNRRSTKVMGLAISPTDPWLMAIACGDNKVRLYDRRRLSLVDYGGCNEFGNQWMPLPLTPSFGPPHSIYMPKKSSARQNDLHSTHVCFSPDGRTVLASFHGDHVYTFDVKGNLMNDEKAAISSYELPYLGSTNQNYIHNNKPCFSPGSDDVRGLIPMSHTEEISKFSMKIHEAHERLLQTFHRCNDCYKAGPNWGGSCSIWPPFTPEYLAGLYGNRAESLARRGWVGDHYLAVLDCSRAKALCLDDRASSLQLVRALHQSGRKKECVHEAHIFSLKFPQHREQISQYLLSRNVRSNPSRSNHSNRDSIRESSTSARVVITMEGRNQPMIGRLRTRSDDEENDDSGSDIDSSDTVRDLPSDKMRVNAERYGYIWRKYLLGEQLSKNEIDEAGQHSEIRMYLERYIGARNFATDVKEASFLGENHIMAGSDDGRVFIWEREGGRLVHAFKADEDIVNCVRPHPNIPVLASSGIEHSIKIWAPTGPPSLPGDEVTLTNIQLENQLPVDLSWSFFNRAIFRQILNGMAEGRESLDMEVDNSQLECIQS